MELKNGSRQARLSMHVVRTMPVFCVDLWTKFRSGAEIWAHGNRNDLSYTVWD